jgi:hypothetical protein
MLQRIHRRLGTAGMVVAVIALIAALGGTALAASGALTGKQKKEVEKIAKKYAGKPGATGAAGANGSPGKDGANGTVGANGTDGLAGPTGPTGLKGNPGVAGETGATGATGATGSFGDATLASGVTERGTWSVTGGVQTIEFGPEPDETVTVGNPNEYVAITYPTPLSGGVTGHFSGEMNSLNEETFTDFDGAGPGTEGCTGTPNEPTAPSGNLCVYKYSASPSNNMAILGIGKPPLFEGNAGVFGTFIHLSVTGPEAWAGGSWALTAF